MVNAGRGEGVGEVPRGTCLGWEIQLVGLVGGVEVGDR